MSEKSKILVVDDDESFVETICEILKLEGFDVADARTAESGFEALINVKPDIVLLDINLPDKSGFEVLKSIKTSKDFSKVPVVLITADSAVSIDEAFDRGADDCIFKPLNAVDTIKIIKKLIKK